MFVERMLNEAVKRLVSVRGDAPIVDAARPLNYRDIDLVVVCGADGGLAGVITKTDVVRQFCSGSACTNAAQAMTRDVVFCYPSDLLRDVWALMKERNVRNVPVISQDWRPIGVLGARDVIEVLMGEVEYEEGLLRDYVMSVGYH